MQNQHTRELISARKTSHKYLQQQRPASPTVTLTRQAGKYKVHPGGVYASCISLHACQVRVTVGDSGLCCCACVMYFEH